MNRHQAIWQLSELADHIKFVIKEIESGDYDEDGKLSYQVALEHLMDHLVRAWHFSYMTDAEIDGLTQDQYETVTRAIPKFGIDQRLMDPSDRPI